MLGSAVTPNVENGRDPIFCLATPAEAGAHGSMGPGWSLSSGRPEGGPVGREDGNELRAPEPLEREQQTDRPRWWVRLRGPVGSLILHLLPLLLLIDWPMSPSAQV
jgi:hypothetical protein